MGFSLSRALEAALPAVTTGLQTGNWLPALGSVGAGFSRPAPTVSSHYAPGVEPAMGAVGAAAPAVAGTVMAAGAWVRMMLARAATFLGRRVTKAGVLDIIRKYGPTAAASALGWSAAETVQFWMAAAGSGRPRRRRGLTYRQIANAKRVARTLQCMSQTFQQACGTVGYSRRRSAPRPFRKGCKR